MQVFKSALRIFFKHPAYIAIYVFWLSCMGIFIGMSSVGGTETTFNENHPDIAIIDRDQSEFSQGLTKFLGEHSTLVDIEDNRLAIQDTTAQGRADYIMIIPENFGEDFMNEAGQDSATPKLETVVSYEAISANMMNPLVNEYLSTASLYVSTGTSLNQAEVVSLTSSDMQHKADASLLQFKQSGPVSSQWILYMQFSGYTIMLAIIVCVGVVLAAFNRTEVRRRNLTSPISSLSMNLQIAAACVVIVLLIWAWVSILGLIVFGVDLAGVDPVILGLSILSLLAFCTVALALGFLLGQLSVSEMVANASGNIIGLVTSFLGGIWIPLDFMGKELVTISHFMPTYYYAESFAKTINLNDYSFSSLAPVLGDMGIMLLFTAAIFAVALVAGRLRMQTANAGGNAAAARVTT